MSNYTKTTDFAAKDSLPTGDAGKIIRGAEFGTEFDNIATAVATKADTAGPTLTGTTTFATLSDGTIGVTAFVDEDNMSSNSATMLPTQQSVKAYVDSQTTAQDLDFEADTGGPLSIDLDSETLTLTGGTGVDTSGAGNAVTFAIDSTVATLTGTQTLTNKTLTSPDVNTPDIDGGTIDGTVIGGATPAAVSATTVSATGNITVGGTVDGRDVAADGTKLDTVETNADVTDTANVTAAGALMDSEVTNLAQVKAFDSADYATAAQGTTADAALPKTGGAMTGAITTNSTFDGRDVATDGTKLDGIEASADVTDTTNVTAAGALMDSELTDLTAVKSLNQGVATTDSPTFAGLTTTANVSFGDNDKAIFGAGSDLQIYHDGSNSYLKDAGTGDLYIQGEANVRITDGDGNKMFLGQNDGEVQLYYNGSEKLNTTNTGIQVTGNISNASGNLTLDVAGETVIDSGSSGILRLKVSGTDYGMFFHDNTHMYVQSNISDGDMVFRGKDGGSTITALTLDMSAAGAATFNSSVSASGISQFADVNIPDNNAIRFGNGQDLQIYHDGTNSHIDNNTGDLTLDVAGSIVLDADSGEVDIADGGTVIGRFRNVSSNFRIQSLVSDKDIVFVGNDGGSDITALTLDMSNAGAATFNAGATFASNVGIGTDSPAKLLETVATGAGSDITALQVRNNSSNTSTSTSIRFVNSTVNTSTAGGAEVSAIRNASDGGALTFKTATNSTATLAERMRIDSSGKVGIGTSLPSRKVHITEPSSGTDGQLRLAYDSTNYADYSYYSIDVAASNPFLIKTGGAERMRIDSSGNVGIGCSPNASADLHVADTSDTRIWVQATSGDTAELYAGTGVSLFNRSNSFLNFGTNNTERMRIDASGNLLVGITSTSSQMSVKASSVKHVADWQNFNDGGYGFNFKNASGSIVGTIAWGSSSTSYNTSSDQRLKDNIVDAPSASDDIDAIQVRSFDWKADGSHQKYGMVAQELQTVAPEAVSAPEDPEEMMGVDYSKLVPMLVKEIQSLRARVAQLETN